jgi:hypothetical protein
MPAWVCASPVFASVHLNGKQNQAVAKGFALRLNFSCSGSTQSKGPNSMFTSQRSYARFVLRNIEQGKENLSFDLMYAIVDYSEMLPVSRFWTFAEGLAEASR